MRAWLASPYRAVGIYLGGSNRACPDGNLSAAWVNSVVASGWNLLPLYVGLQAPCVSQNGLALIGAGSAGTQRHGGRRRRRRARRLLRARSR